MENRNQFIRFKNIFFSYSMENIDIFSSLNDQLILNKFKTFFQEVIKKYENKINLLLVGKRKHEITVLIILNKRPNFRNINIFDMILGKKKDSNEYTLEPKTIEKVISIKETINKILTQSSKYVKFGEIPFVYSTMMISGKSRKEQKEDAYDFGYRLKETFDEDLEMTTEEAKKEFHKYLKTTKNYMYMEKTSMIKQFIKTHFTRVRKLQDFIEFKSFNSFDLANPQIQFMMEYLTKGLEVLRNGNRYPALIAEGITGIGKTQFWFSFLNEIGILFNYMKRRLNYSRKRYDDQAEVDIYDDFRPKYLIEQDLLETIFTSQVGHTVETAKHEPDREILKMKLNIFLCNPHKSFEEFFKTLSKDIQEYLRPNVIFLRLTDQKLFTVQEEKETKKKGKKK
jgi:hypothetical protein